MWFVVAGIPVSIPSGLMHGSALPTFALLPAIPLNLRVPCRMMLPFGISAGILTFLPVVVPFLPLIRFLLFVVHGRFLLALPHRHPFLVPLRRLLPFSPGVPPWPCVLRLLYRTMPSPRRLLLTSSGTFMLPRLLTFAIRGGGGVFFVVHRNPRRQVAPRTKGVPGVPRYGLYRRSL